MDIISLPRATSYFFAALCEAVFRAPDLEGIFFVTVFFFWIDVFAMVFLEANLSGLFTATFFARAPAIRALTSAFSSATLIVVADFRRRSSP
jgi:hypothetical protein